MDKLKNHLWIGTIILLVLFFVFVNKKDETMQPVESSILERVQSEKVIRVGYAAYPPYVIKDIETGALSGYNVDVMNELASRAGFQIEWVETTWQTFIVDLQTKKFDVIIDPMFATVPRWSEINFTTPLGYFNSVAGLTNVNENRFIEISDLNKEGVVIAVPQGWTSEEYARKNLPLSTIKVFPGDTAALAIADVVTGNSNVALADGPSVQQYLEQNPDQNVKPLFLEKPRVITPAAWGIRKGDSEWLHFLNGSIEVMRADSTLEDLTAKYRLYSYDIERTFISQ